MKYTVTVILFFLVCGQSFAEGFYYRDEFSNFRGINYETTLQIPNDWFKPNEDWKQEYLFSRKNWKQVSSSLGGTGALAGTAIDGAAALLTIPSLPFPLRWDKVMGAMDFAPFGIATQVLFNDVLRSKHSNLCENCRSNAEYVPSNSVGVVFDYEYNANTYKMVTFALAGKAGAYQPVCSLYQMNNFTAGRTLIKRSVCGPVSATHRIAIPVAIEVRGAQVILRTYNRVVLSHTFAIPIKRSGLGFQVDDFKPYNEPISTGLFDYLRVYPLEAR